MLIDDFVRIFDVWEEVQPYLSLMVDEQEMALPNDTVMLLSEIEDMIDAATHILVQPCDCYPFRAAQALGSKGVWPMSRYIAVHEIKKT
jgi:hypothetical protein